ncbi:MAG TPA: DUF3466 family protein [Balneolaceae bacterium]|nr:DUF3466 family protein [Balneolaceae bacterium]
MDGDYAITKLIAGGGNDDGTGSVDDVGTIIGYLDAIKKKNKLEVTYSADLGYQVNDLHLWVGCSMEDFPWINKSGTVVPDKLPYSYDENITNRYTFEIDLNRYNCSNNIFLAAYADKMYEVGGNKHQNILPAFEIVDLSNYGLSNATDINDKGQIVGGNLLWDKQEGLTNMGNISAQSINNYEQVVGNAYYWDQEDGLIKIDTLGYPFVDYSYSRAYDINDLGTVVGEVDYYDKEDDDYGFYSMVWNKENGITRTFEWYSTAYSINNYGQITGMAAFYPPPGIYLSDVVSIGPFDGYSYGQPSSINNEGQIVGSIDEIQDESSQKIAASKAHKNYQDLNIIEKLLRLTHTSGRYDFGHVVEMIRNSTFESEALPSKVQSKFKSSGFNSSVTTIPWNLEEQDQIIETAINSNYRSVAFVWDEKTGLQDLGTLGGRWSTAWDINDHGQVVGYSSIAPEEYRAFYWDQEHGMIELPTLGGNSMARAINNNDQIVGYSYDLNGQYHPVMWKVTLKALR